jgi:thiol-disulfide isomerase/thioredoxin
MTAARETPAIRRGEARGGALAAALLVLLAACAPPAPGGAGSGSPSPAIEGGTAERDRFPIVAYQGADLLGAEELDFTELLRGGTPVALNFWAGQCPPCRAEMPAFERVYDRYKDDFVLVGVDIGPFIGLGSHDDAIALLAELNISYPAAYAVDERAVRDYAIVSMPTTVFYTADGAEHSRHSGLMTEQQFEQAVQQIVAAGP